MVLGHSLEDKNEYMNDGPFAPKSKNPKMKDVYDREGGGGSSSPIKSNNNQSKQQQDRGGNNQVILECVCEYHATMDDEVGLSKSSFFS